MSAPMAAGWYPDQIQPGTERYFDGHYWSTDTRPVPGPGIEAAPLPPEIPDAAALEPPKRSAKRRILIAAVIAAVVVTAGAAVLVQITRSSEMTIKGSMVLTAVDGGVLKDSTTNTCFGTGGYADIVPGAQVTVTDNGKTLAIGQLETGESVAADECLFPFTLKVPRGSKFYGLTVSHRGTIQFTEAQLKQGPGLTLGS